MNRLTKRNSKGIAYMAIADSLSKRDQELEGSKPILEGLYAIFQKLAAYEDTGLEPEQIDELNIMLLNDQIRHGRALDKLLEYQKLEKQGLLIKLPCKVGNTIYVLDEKGNIRKCSVYNVTTNIYANTIKDNPYWIGFEIKDNLFGKTVFLTREEAEKALR